MAKQEDHWDADDYQHSASFVPKLAGKVTQWLDLQPDDVVLDIGCGDGILNFEFGKVAARGKGAIHGIDSSSAMIESAKKLCKNVPQCTFDVLDGNDISTSTLPEGKYNKIFSNAAMHWILRPTSTRDTFFPSVASLLAPGSSFTFEMGGLGNVAEMRTALLLSISRRIGLSAATASEPFFFPDEDWVRTQMESAGFRVDRLEREWRPTKADKGGVEGWVRLFGKQMLEAVEDEAEREEVVKEAAEVLREVCRVPGGGEMISYVRLRCQGTKL